ncbi:tRNA (5-methylaminomethyl-2-thiouridine)(34)-methyltransferase MnmD [Gracilimonas sp.]|uniref:tRNA (5-methylaminomethyl-2-thiouridine)(34)-methyltransferase MnmD n=1 Tax=Gracilimonas sp. TaxID=1974203 RepID=UPI00287116D9|nr:tRNA (5-methylaminomethyl-2-thiouridine)(34)-methyltransferase MnmD [Gracilimonas sp.]
MSPEIHQTKDGSSTLYSSQFDQFYHNPNGAASESLYVFFETSGLNRYLKSAESLTILEIGFGTGLNFLLLLDLVKTYNLSIPIKFYSIEAFPIDPQVAEEINFSDHLKNPELNILLPEIFSELKSGINLIKPFDNLPIELHLFVGNFEDFTPENLYTDFIFHDPFSPDVNPELWTSEVFEKLYHWSSSEAMLTTYCAASKARGAMCAAGWHVAKTRGALGKREMTIASSSKEKLSDFKSVNEKLLAERYRNNDF